MDDLISRQAAITTAVRAAIDWHRLANPQYSIAYCIGEAMRGLPSAQPDLQPTCNQLATDCISRQVILNWLENEWDGIVVHVFDGIRRLPSAQPEIKPHRNYEYLSDYWCECGWHLGKKGTVKYCANCGRKVKWDE